MAARQGITLRAMLKNRKAKYKVNTKKYIYTNSNNNKSTKQYSYTSRKITTANGKKKYVYKYS